MLREPVAIQITRGTLEAIAVSNSKWNSVEAVWQAFRLWSSKRRSEVALSFEEKPPYFHELQDLYDFGIETCSSLGREGFLKLSGRYFAGILLRERLPDLVAACLAPAGDVAAAIENLFRRFMEQYSRYLYRIRGERSGGEITFSLVYSEPEAIARHLEVYQKDPHKSFTSSFISIVSIVEACVEYLLDPWDPKNLTSDAEKGEFRIRFPEGTKFNYKKLVETLTRFATQLEKRHAAELFARDVEQDLILESPFMREKWEKIKLASATDELILLRGEPGTGKTYLAARIHEMSARKGRPFVEVGLTADIGVENLVQSHLFGHVKGAFTSAFEDKQGLFALSNSGTIFLDEIGDGSPDLQAKLLRVIEKKTFKPLGSTKDMTVDIRILTATNRDLDAMVRAGKFREDLFHRLNVIQIELPPLRDRRDELPILAGHFVRRIAAEIKKPPKAVSAEVLRFLKSYRWPGNIRELIHVLKYALLFSKDERIELQDLPDYLQKSTREGSTRPPAAESPSTPPKDEVINYGRLCDLLARRDELPLVKSETSNCPWHIDYAKKLYLRALIQECRGNLREMTSFWDRDSENTLRSLIKSYGLWDDLEKARKS